MNKITREIANILEAQIEGQTSQTQLSGLTIDQIGEISKFAKGYSRSAPFPYPLKVR